MDHIFQGGAGRLNAVALWTAEDATLLRTAARFLINYLAHFNPVFLFFHSDSTLRPVYGPNDFSLARHGIPGTGQLLLVDLIFLPIGCWVSFKHKLPLSKPLLLAFLLGPIGAAITRIGIPHALRAIPMVVPAAIWGGVGLAWTAEWIADGRRLGRVKKRSRRKKALRQRDGWIAGALVAASILYAFRVYLLYWNFYHENPVVLAPEIGFGSSHRAAFENVISEKKSGEKIWIDARIPYAPYFVLFFAHLPPRPVSQTGFQPYGIEFFDPAQNSLQEVLGRIASGDWIVSLVEGGDVSFAQKETPVVRWHMLER